MEAFKGKLQTNEIIISFGKEQSNYFCCFDRQGLDRIEHIQQGPVRRLSMEEFC